MSFPVVETTAESAQTAATSSHVVTMPSGIQAGDLLIVIIAIGGSNAATFNALTGWTELVDEGVNYGLYVAYRLADGTEGSTVTFTSSATNRSASIAYRISGASDPGVQAPQISSVATGTSDAPNPNTCTPTGGAKDYLWITFFSNGAGEEADDDTWLNNAATNYTNALAKTGGTGGTNVNAILGASQRTNNAASEDAAWPAASTDVSRAWRAYTMAVHPRAAVVSEKTGSGNLDLLAFGFRARDPITFEKVGKGTMGIAAAEAGVTKAGAGVAGFTASGAEAGVFTETGSGISARVGAGTNANVFSELGSGISARAASGTRERTFTKSGAGIANFTASGPETKARETVKSGAGIASFTAAGADAASFTETGTGILAAVGSGPETKSGTISKAGTGALVASGSGSDAVAFAETGSGVAPLSGSGSETKAGGTVYQKQNAGVLSASGSGTDDQTFIEKGTTFSARVGAGTDAVTFGESGTGVAPFSASGAKQAAQGAEYVKAGQAVMVLTASGPRQRIISRAGTGIRGEVGAGTRAVVYGEKGAGVLVLSARGTRDLLIVPGDVAIVSDVPSAAVVLSAAANGDVQVSTGDEVVLVFSDP